MRRFPKTKSFIKQLVPFLGANRSSTAKGKLSALFDGDDRLFKEALESATSYGEYGCGETTKWVAKNTNAQIISVDTSQQWLDTVAQEVSASRVLLLWIDCGPLRQWGAPKSYEKRENFQKYAEALWLDGQSHDVVLIDGRFRVFCFLTSLLHAQKGTRILFDDYIGREEYHIVEEFTECRATCGRQVLFVVPDLSEIDRLQVEKLAQKFEYVMA